MENHLKHPVRNVNQEYLLWLEVLSNKIYPLPGSHCKGGKVDSRHKNLPEREASVNMFDHLATIRHRPTGMLFVVFRQTMDALHFEQRDPVKYPSWLMDSDVKKTELSVYIHTILPPYVTNPTLVAKDPKIINVASQTRIHLWLSEISVNWVFDTVAYFLLQKNVITQEMYGKLS